MKRPDRNNVMNSIREIIGLPLPKKGAIEYFTRMELLEILTFLKTELSNTEAKNNDNKDKARTIER